MNDKKQKDDPDPLWWQELSAKSKKMFELCREEAKKSQFRSRHGAILVNKGGKVLHSAFNSTAYTKFGMRFRKRGWGESTQHAEIKCILGLDKGLTEGGVIYVVRIDNDGSFKMSKPCHMCAASLVFVGIKKVIYTTNDGIEVIKL